MDDYGSSAESYQSPGIASSLDADETGSAATTPPSASAHHIDNEKACEAQAFFSDLSNYLGIGCLVFHEILADEEYLTEPRWLEITQLPLLRAFGGSIYAQLLNLSAAGWIKVLWSPSVDDPSFQVYRVYVLPFDAGHRFVDRKSKALTQALESLLAALDVSCQTWLGRYASESEARAEKFDPWATREEGSLFWMFNKIPSPKPSTDAIEERYAREALDDLLNPEATVPGLQSLLYPYQRRSAGLMLQRESTTKLDLDPRLEERMSPEGVLYYYSARDTTVLRHPRYYEACKGGILGETMGSGKTLICLALILATKNHFPKIPPRWNRPVSRSSVGSLASMAISSINRKSVPWPVEFSRIAAATGEDMTGCRERLEAEPASYEVTREPQRWNRATVIPPPEKVVLAGTTLVVVPHNLLRQWLNEIQKHTEEGSLDVLVMEDPKKPLPSSEQLRRYDMILFTRKRFEQESKDGSDGQGRRMGTTQLLCRCPYIGSTRTRNCTCLRTDDLYGSPLKQLHFLRIIIDEGHFFSNNSGMAASVAEKLLKVDHRWVVSGTPAKDLLGVEVDMSSAENLWRTPATADSREAVLQQRREFSDHDKTGAIKSLGSLASTFLKIRPWASSEDSLEVKAEWDEYVFRHEGFRSRKSRTFSGFSTSLRRTLEAMVIKTRPEDVEQDIDMPPLSHEIIRLEPSFYDKLTANLFTLVLTANAVTSERTDQDYLFHKNSAKARYQLVANLRQSAFFWTGFSEDDIEASITRSRKYLEKEDTTCSPEDRQLLTSCLQTAEMVLNSDGWKGMSRSHELGLYVEDWPRESWDHWAFDVKRQPLLTGISHLLRAQRHVHDQVADADPGAGLSGAGITALLDTRSRPQPKTKVKKEGADGPTEQKDALNKAGIPTSSLDGEPTLKRRSSSGLSPSKRSPGSFKVAKPPNPDPTIGRSKKIKRLAKPMMIVASQATPANGSPTMPEATDLPLDSAFLRSRVVGTTSAKLSYLCSEILKYYQQEKILVFYDGDNAAYYIAQMLDLLHVKHEIYAKSLKASQKSEYAVRFDQQAEDRVLLMDVRQAAFGLNLPAASRIYFVNPVCRENIEAQAIKRAHRIGQTKPVHVETLVLKGTIEEKMLDRSKRMTRAEHLNASHLEDDGGIKQIIQNAVPVPIEQTSLGRPQMAPLAVPQQVWGREGWREYQLATTRGQGKKRKASTPDDHDTEMTKRQPKTKKPKTVRRTLAFLDCSSGVHGGDAGPSHTSQDLDVNEIQDTVAEASGSSSAASQDGSGHSTNGYESNTGEKHAGTPRKVHNPAAPPFSPILAPSRNAHVPAAPPFSPILAPDRNEIASVTAPLLSAPAGTIYPANIVQRSVSKMSVSTLLNGQSGPPERKYSAGDDLMKGIVERL